MSELLSYKNILSDIKNFKRAGTIYADKAGDFNLYDTPSHKYFKILFYFGSTPELFATDYSSGLLAPTWEYFNKNNSKKDYYNYNSAWAYLKMNNEEERAEKIEHFVTLLSDISSNSPWYFYSIGGVQEALERKVTEDGKLEMSEPKKLTITCLPDAFDNRIGTLLELYRDVTWSWTHKKEVIPANLRKFDMAVYIFESMTNNMHKDTDVLASENGYNVSYKMIEFHDCEFNYNSVKSGWSELNNETGFSPKYTIDISYNDCYEISYNDIMMRKIGDVILTDLLNSANDNEYESKPQTNSNKLETELLNRRWPEYKDIIKDNKKIIYFGNIGERNGTATENIIEKVKYEYQPGFVETAVGQVAGHLVKDVKSLFNKAILGNLHTASLTQIGLQLSEAAKGNLIKTGMTIAQYAKTIKNNNNEVEAPTGNIYPFEKTTKQKPTGDIYPDNNSNTVTEPNGNIYPFEKTTKQKPNGDIYPFEKTAKQKPTGDIYPDNNNTVTEPTGNIYPFEKTTKQKPLGNIFNKSTLANNL